VVVIKDTELFAEADNTASTTGLELGAEFLKELIGGSSLSG